MGQFPEDLLLGIISERVSSLNEYIAGLEKMEKIAPDEHRRTEVVNLKGIAQMLKELYELQSASFANTANLKENKPPAGKSERSTQETVEKFKKIEPKLDWMIRRLDEAKDLEKEK